MCLKKSILKWHTSLSAFVKKEMNVDLWIWKNELLRKYRFDRFVFRKKAKNFVFCFDDSLTFSQYFFRKTNFLHDVKITEKNMMMQYLWNGLEFHLQTTISRKKNGDFLKNFEKRVRQNEIAIRRVHELNKKNRYEKSYKNRFEKLFVKSYEKLFFRNKKREIFFVERIDKFLKKFIKNNFVFIRIKKVKIIVFKNIFSSTSKKRSTLSRSCRWCNDFHWNNDCSKEKIRKEAKKILWNVIEKKDDDIVLDDKNKKTYEAFQKMIHRVKFDFDSDSKNEF